jgi:hypothetical protein
MSLEGLVLIPPKEAEMATTGTIEAEILSFPV